MAETADLRSVLDSGRTRTPALEHSQVRIVGNQTPVLVPANPFKGRSIDYFGLCEPLGLDSEFILFLLISRDLDSNSDVFELVEFLKVVKNEKLPEEAAVNYRSKTQLRAKFRKSSF